MSLSVEEMRQRRLARFAAAAEPT
eukprot:SAG22_NODE_20375_length_266_cov_0.676647_2_plen_23_part_01